MPEEPAKHIDAAKLKTMNLLTRALVIFMKDRSVFSLM